MPGSTTLRETFVARLAEQAAQEAHALGDLDQRLHALVARAREDLPELSVDDARFVAFVAERLAQDQPLAQALEGVRAAELRLTRACADGDPFAIAAFRQRHFDRILASARRSGPAQLAEEVAQRVVMRLLVAEPGTEPAIVKYAGRGSLEAWLEVTATREARTVARWQKGRREVSSDEGERLFDAAVSSYKDPELEHLKKGYRAEFKRAFQSALDTLEPRERNILRHEHLDGLDGAKIGAIYGVHKSTVSRWHAQARKKLLGETRRILEAEWRVTHNEFASMMRLIQSQLDVSLARVLDDE